MTPYMGLHFLSASQGAPKKARRGIIIRASLLALIASGVVLTACGGNIRSREFEGSSGGGSDDDSTSEPGGGGANDDSTTEPGGSANGSSDGDQGVGPIASSAGRVKRIQSRPAVSRAQSFMDSPERFNRYYTDAAWRPSRVRYVSPNGNADGTSRDRPMTVKDAFETASPGDKIVFTASPQHYEGCFEIDQAHSGTYDAPIVLYGESRSDGSLQVHIDCCNSDYGACFNFEGANYIAVDGFLLQGGNYGVRAVGLDVASAEHSKGIAVVNTEAWSQNKDPFFTGQSDWAVFDNVVGHDAGKGDGHGIYLSNGTDFNIVRNCELYNNAASDFQINADPEYSCAGVGVAYTDPACDGSAKDGLGQGVSEFNLVENNYFHHGLAQGPNFTSVRNSLIRNNIFALYQRHGTSFWQETTNPKLGSSGNRFYHNLLVGNNEDHVLRFSEHSDANDVKNNVLLAVTDDDNGKAALNRFSILVLVDNTVPNNTYAGNLYVGSQFEGYKPNASEFWRQDFSPSWIPSFPNDLSARPVGFRLVSGSPASRSAALLPGCETDFSGQSRKSPTDIGPFQSD